MLYLQNQTCIFIKVHLFRAFPFLFQLLQNRPLLEGQKFDLAIVDLLYNECGLAFARDGIPYV